MEIVFKPEYIKIVDIESVRPNSWNPKDKNTKEFALVKKGLQLKGLRLPVIVRENDGFEIIDGEQRWTAWKELGHKEILIYNMGAVDDKEAKELTIWYEQKVPFNEIKLAELVTDLAQNFSNLELPFEAEEVDRMLDLVHFDWDDFKEDDKGSNGVESDPSTLKKTFSIEVVESDYQVIMEALKLVREVSSVPYGDEQAIVKICEQFIEGNK